MTNSHETQDWNPLLYLRFRQERTQPSIDLVSRIGLEAPQRIVDIGCGPGNSTHALAVRWPKSEILGVDNSPEMIKKAQQDYPALKWLLADAAHFELPTPLDLVFSNSTIQWIPNHDSLLTRFFGMLNPGGALAVQVPRFFSMPLGKSIDEIATRPQWKARLKGCSAQFTQHDFAFYYQVLSRHTEAVELWETSYVHVLQSQPAVLDWIRSTGLRPYLDRLESAEQKEKFEAELLEEIKRHYPAMPDGKVLFPFPRMFFLAYKKA